MLSDAVAGEPLGDFSAAVDVGEVKHAGRTTYNADAQSYRLSGSGANIWFDRDEFHFAHQKMSGDFLVRTRAKFLGEGVDPHRKIGWMVRTGLSTDSAMVCATVHGDGLASLQYRRADGGQVEEVQPSVDAPDVIQLERRGGKFLMSVAKSGEPFETVEVGDWDLSDELFVGLFVCSHNADVVETGEFDNVRLVRPAPIDLVPYRDYLGSRLEVLDLATGRREVVYTAKNSIQAPNWTTDGEALIYNSEGLIYRFDLARGEPTVIPTGFVDDNNNDHSLSFDGKQLGLSSASGEQPGVSIIYTVPVTGGTPKQVTPIGPSFLHGWSPDGEWLTYTANREGDAYNIYKTRSDGSGTEVRLTDEATLDDGSEYSPDGEHIYFNSARTGSMELWRMRSDGSGLEQLTDDAFQNWFPHVSPDGESLVFLSYLPEVAASDHPFYKQVYLRSQPIDGGEPRVIAYLYGGQGTMNVASWSPDGRRIAFVSNTGE